MCREAQSGAYRSHGFQPVALVECVKSTAFPRSSHNRKPACTTLSDLSGLPIQVQSVTMLVISDCHTRNVNIKETSNDHPASSACRQACRRIQGNPRCGNLCRDLRCAFPGPDPLVRDAITDELLDAAERMEKVIHEIRRETDLHELGL
jgi:hypothetical protein